MNSTDQQLFKDAIDKFGVAHQRDKLIEEMAELTMAIIKFRQNPTKENEDNIHEEFTDVLIVMGQIRTLLEDETLAYWHQTKVERLKGLVYGK